MDLGHLNNHQVHQVARFHAAAAVASRGYQAEVVGSCNRLSVDGRTVQVSSRRQAGTPWQAKVSAPTVENGAHAVIFVDLTGETPDFYLAPADLGRPQCPSAPRCMAGQRWR